MRKLITLFCVLAGLAGCTPAYKERYESNLTQINAMQAAGKITEAEAMSLRIQNEQALAQGRDAAQSAYWSSMQYQQNIRKD